MFKRRIVIIKMSLSADRIENMNTTEDVVDQPIHIKQSQQNNLDILMGILEDNQANIPEGDYLRGMNALCSLHKKKETSELNSRFMTHEEVCDDEEVFDQVIELAEDIVNEISGGSILHDDSLVDSGDETAFLNEVINYHPSDGDAGFGTNSHLMYHAQRFIYCRLYNDMIDELDRLRPAVCECGWRGTKGNLQRHTKNRRHKTWLSKNTIIINDRETSGETDITDTTDTTDSDIFV